MKRRYYLLCGLISLFLSQFYLVDKVPEAVFPLATWNLFSDLSTEKEISTLYFENIQDGQLCYFYICPGVDQKKISATHPYHLVRWRNQTMNVADYFKGKLDLEKLGYKIHIKTETTTMVEKWREISLEIEKMQSPNSL